MELQVLQVPQTTYKRNKMTAISIPDLHLLVAPVHLMCYITKLKETDPRLPQNYKGIYVQSTLTAKTCLSCF
jgi:hypothetical protein